jgi:hypothetical protein
MTLTAQINPNTNTFYALGGDENSLYTLDAQIFTIVFDWCVNLFM